MADKTKKYGPFLDELAKNWSGPRRTSSTYSFVANAGDITSPGSIRSLFSLEEKHLSATALKSLEILENEAGFLEPWTNLKWKCAAFLAIQDVFSGPLFDSKDNLTFFQQWYFYYESKYLLIEMILCGLNGFSASIGPLSRLFIEFSLLQNYFFRKINHDFSYAVLEQYFKDKHNPRWSIIIVNSACDDSFCRPIKRRLDLHLKGLSDSCVHPYQPVFSPKHLGSFTPEQTLEGLYFPYKLSMILEPVLWMYYANFPMVFHPMNLESKFGFNYPLGMFIDDIGAAFIRHSLSPVDISLFTDYSKTTPDYSNLMEFYSSRPILSEAEIISTWDTQRHGEFKDILHSHAIQMAEIRGLREIMALNFRPEPSKTLDRIVDKLAFNEWRFFYKKI